MSSLRGCCTVVCLALAAAAVPPAVGAGTAFRLEIGHPIAAGPGVKSKNVVLVVRPMACDDPASVRINATAEGFVGGRRQSVPVDLADVGQPGVYAVRRQWPDGQWLVILTGTCPGRQATASTLVPLTSKGFIRDKTQVLRSRASAAQIESALAGLTASAP